ncbi:MAG TPA: SDR family NAD(P)-dependent oxidoreductase [Gemmatimonadaceae bacterium]|nr:SDR family NAD(P)-dependent oxidoreductase [Gemmatimonadaceae bacterium]
MDLKHGKALVTGGSSGIGYATAQMLRDRGADVAICGRKADAIEQAAAELGAIGIVADVSREDDVVRMVQRVIGDLGGYNILINNAGFGSWAPLVDTKADDFRRVWETNVFGAMLVARESARHFVKQNTGNIINIASTAGKRGSAGGSIYSSTKFAVNGLTESWRAELRKNNIRVMQVNPSEVQTNFFVSAGSARATNPSKLEGTDIASIICDMLEMHDRAMVTEATVFATNPSD